MIVPDGVGGKGACGATAPASCQAGEGKLPTAYSWKLSAIPVAPAIWSLARTPVMTVSAKTAKYRARDIFSLPFWPLAETLEAWRRQRARQRLGICQYSVKVK